MKPICAFARRLKLKALLLILVVITLLNIFSVFDLVRKTYCSEHRLTLIAKLFIGRNSTGIFSDLKDFCDEVEVPTINVYDPDYIKEKIRVL